MTEHVASNSDAWNFDPDVATAEWPRLYLDTADLLDIADGRASSTTVQDLFCTIAEKRWLVLFTVEHLVDVAAMGSADGGAQLGGIAEQFPWRVIATKDPTDIEPWTESSTDIELAFAPNIRELYAHPATGPVVSRFTRLQDHARLAEEAARSVAAPGPREARSAREIELRAAAMDALVRDCIPENVEKLVGDLNRDLERPLGKRTLGRVSTRMREFALAWEQLDPLVQEDEVGRDAVWDWMIFSGDAQRAPGTNLAMRFFEERRKDSRRRPTRSDLIDGMHSFYFPYVDLATCDRYSHSILSRLISNTKGPRAPRLIRTGRLDEVVAALRDL